MLRQGDDSEKQKNLILEARNPCSVEKRHWILATAIGRQPNTIFEFVAKTNHPERTMSKTNGRGVKKMQKGGSKLTSTVKGTSAINTKL